MFHLAGIPSYLVLAELAMSHVLRGKLPTPDYPAALRERAPNDKTLLTSAGLAAVDEFVAASRPDPQSLRGAVERSKELCSLACRTPPAVIRR
jgi:hypothetical protein